MRLGNLHVDKRRGRRKHRWVWFGVLLRRRVLEEVFVVLWVARLWVGAVEGSGLAPNEMGKDLCGMLFDTESVDCGMASEISAE